LAEDISSSSRRTGKEENVPRAWTSLEYRGIVGTAYSGSRAVLTGYSLIYRSAPGANALFVYSPQRAFRFLPEQSA
jgi:hypothetical protein